MTERGVRLATLAVALVIVLYAVLTVATGAPLFQRPVPEPLPTGLLERARVLMGLFTALTLPGFFVALAVPAPGPREPVSLLLQTLGYSTVAYILNLTVLKLALGEGTLAGLLILGGIEAGLVTWRFGRNAGRVRAPGRHELAGFAMVALLVAGLAWSYRGFMVRDLEDYWYDDAVMGEQSAAGAEAGSLEAAGVTLERDAGWRREPSGGRELFWKDAVAPGEGLTLRAVTPTQVTLRYVWQGPVGGRLRLACEDLQAEGTIERAPVEEPGEGPTLRYLDRGLVMVSLPVMVRQERRCTIETGMVQASTTQAAVTGVPPSILVELTGWPLDALPLEERFGWTLSHYYQILNIAENVEWARRTLDTQWVTINQPPLWSYVYSAVLVYAGDGLWSINLFFFLLVGLTVLVVVRLAGLEQGEAPWPFWLVPIGLAISHARIIVGSGSTNFPDNLYAFAMVSSMYLLAQGHAGGFAGGGLATSLLRYPGSTVLAIAAGLGAIAFPGRRRAIFQAGLWFAGVIVLLCLGFGMVALFSGRLEHWLEILHFETFPEHFHDQYDLRELMQRPPEFYRLLLWYAGFTPVLLLAMKGRVARWVAGTGLIYTFFLCFIDHFPSHYFVPLLHLTGAAVVATALARPSWQRWLALTLACGGLAYCLLLPPP